MQKINLLVADDHKLFANLITKTLHKRKTINTVGVAHDGAETLEMVKKQKIDMVLLDLNMPKIDGLRVLETIKDDFPKMKVVILSSIMDSMTIQKALKLGALGYLSKSIEENELYNAILKINDGETYCSSDTMQSVIENMVNRRKPLKSELNVHLSKREKEIANLIIEEKTSSTIAKELCISQRTVETHRKNIMHKLGVKNTIGLMKFLIKWKFVEE